VTGAQIRPGHCNVRCPDLCVRRDGRTGDKRSVMARWYATSCGAGRSLTLGIPSVGSGTYRPGPYMMGSLGKRLGAAV